MLSEAKHLGPGPQRSLENEILRLRLQNDTFAWTLYALPKPTQ
jgi:hypothetical protein